jgi:hypothetical protein
LEKSIQLLNEKYKITQQQILQCEQDLENYLKLKPEQNLIIKECLLTLYEMQEQVNQTEIERWENIIFEYKNDEDQINTLKLEDWGKQEKKFMKLSNRSWEGNYPYGKKNDFSNYFGWINNKHEFVKIESVTLSHSKQLSSKQKHKTKEEINDISAKFDTSKVSEGEIPEVGNYEIIESNFKQGIFRWKFHPHESFRGTVKFSFEVEAKNTTEYKNKIKELNDKISNCQKELKITGDELKNVNKKLAIEKKIIEEYQNSQDAKQYLLYRFLNLNYNVNMFIEYLFKKESISRLDFSSIENKFSDIDNLKNDQSIQIILREMKLKTLEDLKLILKELNSNKTSLYDERQSFGEKLEKSISEFNEVKEKIIKIEKCELKIIEEIKKIIKLKENTDDILNELSELRSSSKDNLKKTFSKTLLVEISLENTLSQAFKENSDEENIDTKSILQNIDLSGNYRERLASVTILKTTNDDVIIF